MQDALAGKRIIILGLARQGKAMARFAARVGATVIGSDLRTKEMLSTTLEELADLPMDFALGSHPLSMLDGADVLVLSGGVPSDLPIVQEARRRGLTITNDSQEFIKRSPAPVVGITGSAGKTTTTALTGAMGQASGCRTWIGGNIGRPLLADVWDMSLDDLVIQELSSFQLELWQCSPQVAAVLNITPNHLDRHKTMDAYRSAKGRILKHQTSDDVAVLSRDDAGAASLSKMVNGRVRYFSMQATVSDGAMIKSGRLLLRDGHHERFICHQDVIPLRGKHNVLNTLAALVLADSRCIETGAMEKAIRTFRGVEHRLETILTIDGVQYVNDSIATAPERAMAALSSFEEDVILLAGGKDKDMVWDHWSRLVVERVKSVVLFGALATTLRGHLESAQRLLNKRIPVVTVETMAEAVSVARETAESGDIVLLSPGGTSFDAYENFTRRGEAFREIVYQLARQDEIE